MIRRIYAALCAAVAVVAVFGVLAFQQRTLAPTATGTPVVMARTASGAPGARHYSPLNGARHHFQFRRRDAASDATAAGTGSAVLYVKNASGGFVPVGSSPATPAPVAAVTRSS